MNTTIMAGLLSLFAATTPAATPQCEIDGAVATSADAARARSACQIARSRFAELFGEPVPGVRVVLWERPGYRAGVQGERAAIFWPTSSAMAARAPSAAAAERHVAAQWSDVLPHELSHLLLAVRFFPADRATGHGGYGTPLPDWLDEAVAIWAEPAASRRGRLAQARSLPAARRGLRAILSARHPAAGEGAAFTARDGTARAPDDALRAFYAQAIAVLAFVHDTGGAAAVRELVQRLVADPADPDAIVGLPGMPDEFGGVAAAWQEWLAADASPAGR